jgi:hypothetical protein
MRRTFPIFFTFVLFALSINGSAWAGDAEILGTGIGAAVGGLFGSSIGRGGGQFAATSIGVVTGGLVGNEIGHSIRITDTNRATDRIRPSQFTATLRHFHIIHTDRIMSRHPRHRRSMPRKAIIAVNIPKSLTMRDVRKKLMALPVCSRTAFGISNNNYLLTLKFDSESPIALKMP